MAVRRARTATAIAVAALLTSGSFQPAFADENKSGPPYVVTADTLTYDGKGVLTATGNVEVSRGKEVLLADEVTYEPEADIVTARGHVVLVDPKGTTVFGDEAEVTGDLREGFINSVRVLTEEGDRVAANRATRRDGQISEMEQAVYSPCPLCKGEDSTPLWQIKAQRVVHDQEARTLTYKNAWLEFFGVPTLYTPWFRHPDPGVKRQSGFLTPILGSNSTLGLFAKTPYYFNLAPDRDFTFTPIITQNSGVVLGGEYRQLWESGYGTLSGSGTYTEAYAEDPAAAKEKGDESRGHIYADGRQWLSDSTAAGGTVFLTTDNSYLTRYNISDEDVLENRVFVEHFDDENFLAADGYYFQGLRGQDRQSQIPIAIPLLTSHLVSDPMVWDSRFSLDTSTMVLTRRSGLDTRRLSSTVGWEVPYLGPLGDIYRLRLSTRADFYNTEGDPQTFGDEGGNASRARVLPRLTADWSWPLIGETGTWQHEIEPMVSFTAARDGGNSGSIPNEDSQDFEFDETNLWESDRFPGLDRVDSGTKVSYGLRFNSSGESALQVGGAFGQSYRILGDSPYPADSGLDSRLSDYVGRIDFRPISMLDLNYRFRLSKDQFDFRRQELGFVAGPSALFIYGNYLNLSKEPSRTADAGFESREELIFGARAQLTNNIAIGGQIRRDLTAGETVADNLGLIYTHPCLTLTIGYERSFTQTGELEDEKTFLVRLTLKNLGDFETGSALLGSE